MTAAEQGNRALAEARYESAATHFEKACQQHPGLAELHKGLAICRQHLGQIPQAEAAYRIALHLSPQDSESWANLGLVLTAAGQAGEGCRCLEQAAEIAPDRADIFYNLGNAHHDAGVIQKTLVAYQRVLDLDPNHYDTLINLGDLYKQKADLDKAETCFRHALEVADQRPEAYVNLTSLLFDRDDHEEAETVAREGLARAPLTADLYYNLGNLYKSEGAYSEALEAYRQALLIAPNHARAHWNKALTHLALGQYQEGWGEYEWRQKKEDWSRYYPYHHDTPTWRGEDIGNKTLLVHDEQGYGDTIQFSRYLAMVKARCKRLIFETRRYLIPLFEGAAHIDHLVERPAVRHTSHSWDLHVPLLSLPFLLRTKVDSIPATSPYLLPDPLKVESFSRFMDRRQLNIGLVWAGNPEHRNDHYRSMPLSQLQPLFDLSRLSWHSLQKGPAAKEVSMLSVDVQLRNWRDHLRSFADTAALIWTLDLVISVDTAVAHLGGALGKPVWLVLPPRNVDWRWQLNRKTNPWYPSVSLFRQPHGEDRSFIVDLLARHLKKFPA